MRLYQAKYIYPVSSAPIVDGMIAVDGERIAAVGTAAEVMQQYTGAQVIDLGEVMLLPQAVNAHTHLELTALAALGKEYIPERSFVQWILELLRGWRATPRDVLSAGAQDGCRMLLDSGTAAVGDISNTHVSLEPLLESGLYGIIYYEIYSPDPAHAAPLFERAQQQVRRWRSEYGEERIRFGVTLHTPFTVSPELFRLTVPWVIEEHVPFCVHSAESPAESEYLLHGTGEIATILEPTITRTNWIPVPGVSPVQYLASLGALAPSPVLAHGIHVNADDLRLLVEYHAPVVHCPRSNYLLNCGRMPIEAYQVAGALLAMGTDSLASSSSLSIWEEAVSAMRMHRAAGVQLNPHDLLRTCTLDGARALGFEHLLGSLEPGKLARLAVGRLNTKHAANADDMLQLLWNGERNIKAL